MRETYYAVHCYEIIPCHIIAKKDRKNGLKYAADSRRDKRRFSSAFRTRKEAEAAAGEYDSLLRQDLTT